MLRRGRSAGGRRPVEIVDRAAAVRVSHIDGNVSLAPGVCSDTGGRCDLDGARSDTGTTRCDRGVLCDTGTILCDRGVLSDTGVSRYERGVPSDRGGGGRTPHR